MEGVGVTATEVKTLPYAVIGTFGPDLYKLLSRFIPVLPQLGSQGAKRKLIDDFTGVLRHGQVCSQFHYLYLESFVNGLEKDDASPRSPR